MDSETELLMRFYADFVRRLEKTFGRQQAGSLLGKFFQGTAKGLFVLNITKATNGSGSNTFRAAARIGSGASPPFFEKKVLPLKLPFPKNFSKGKYQNISNNQRDPRERLLAGARQRGSGAAPRRPALEIYF